MKNQSRSETLHVLIVDDHPMVRDGIRGMLESANKYFHFEVDEAEGGREAVAKAKTIAFDVAIVDYQMPEMPGDEVVRDMLRYNPQLKILAVSNYDQLAYIQKMMVAGARGYVLKNIEPPELVRAIKTIWNNEPYYSHEIAAKLLSAGRMAKDKKKRNKYGLTPRELEVLHWITKEKTNEEIAAKLFVTKRTIDTHRQRILAKVQARNTAGLIKAAYELNLI